MILAIVQARMGSSRLPGKVLKEANGKSLIEILLHRLSSSKKIDKILLATGENRENDILARAVEILGYEVFRGNEEDVLDRYYQAASLHHPETVVRITGDCPLIDSTIVDKAVNKFVDKRVQYLNNFTPPTYPDGMDVEVFSYQTLERAWKDAITLEEKEHVTLSIRKRDDINKEFLVNEHNWGNVRLTVDELADFQVVSGVIDYFWPNLDFSLHEIMILKKQNPELFLPNRTIERNEGSAIGSGQRLYRRAKKLIPGGTMLLSKKPEMFLPEHWPSYFEKAKGCRVWDLDGKEYIDMSIMGIGTNTLGYGHPEVDDAVRQVINRGNMSTLNCPDEVYLAEKLIELHPWAEMIRFARSGGEANSIAIRIARAASGKDQVAICGYHGWHDWYLAANLGDESCLDGHLLPGLAPNGVPRELKGTVLPFAYNDFQSLEKLVREHNIGVIKMEVSRAMDPEEGYLDAVRQLATEHGIILVFDECTSGFRETFGGLHKKYGVDPDMMTLGKTLGNGYAITAVLGRSNIMKVAETTFISSTFWTERIGSAAALKTLEVMEREKSWEKITAVGKSINHRWRALAEKNEFPINISGRPAMINFVIPVENWLKYKTLITQEMLKKGILAANSVYVCTEHTDEIVANYFQELDPIFSLISECENGRNIDDLLQGPVCHDGFSRLN
jgi:glutamate-1-semialdehyde 2,1-aminomutase